MPIDEREQDNRVLRTLIITALTETGRSRDAVYEKIGESYYFNAPKYLYKYYSESTLNLDAIKKHEMWYSAPCNFNDAFDCDISINEKALFECFLKEASQERRIRQGSSGWKNLQGVVHKQIHNLQEEFEETKRTTGISCLSESDSSLLMWAHYANNHKEMCVEYELLKISDQLKFTPVPVIYTNDRVTLSSLESENLDRDTMKIFVESITTKSSEWNYEKEWRIIRDEAACGTRWNKADKGALLEMIRPTSITLGCRAEGDFEKSVRKYCEKEKVTLYKMEKNKDKYQLGKKWLWNFRNKGNSKNKVEK